MSLFSNPGFWAGLAGVVAAVTALVRVIKLRASVKDINNRIQQHVDAPNHAADMVRQRIQEDPSIAHKPVPDNPADSTKPPGQS